MLSVLAVLVLSPRLAAAASGWVLQPAPSTAALFDVQALDPNTAVAVGANGTILKTTDGGATWVALSSGTSASLNAVHFLDANNGWAVGGTILNTTDGGRTWTGGTSFSSLQDVRFLTSTIGVIVGSVGSQGFLRTTDGGQTWTELSLGNNGTNKPQGLFFLDSLRGWAVGLNADRITTTCDAWGSCYTTYTNPKSVIWRTTDGGATWSTFVYQIGSVRFLRSVSFVDSSTGWVVGDGGLVLKTTDGGVSWVAQTSGTTTRLYSVAFVSSTTGWIVGADGVIRKTTDGAASWADQGTVSSTLYSVHFADAMTGWIVGNDGKIVKTTDAGGSCTYALSPETTSFEGGGGTGSLSVTAPGICGWTAASDATWLEITSGASGVGDGTVGYSVAQNQTGASRTGHVTVQGQTLTVEQAACGSATYTLSPASASFPSEGGSGTLSVAADGPGCWTASSDATWLTITSGRSGQGSGSVGYSVGPNVTGARTGHVVAAGQTSTVDQAACGPACPSLTITTLAGLAGQSGSADGTGSTARFYYPHGVAVDASGNVYVADSSNHTIRKVSPAGEVTTLAGLAGTSGSADGTGSAARFYGPRGVATDASGSVYVADSSNDTIRKVSPAGEVTTLAGLAGASGSADGTGSAARFKSPEGVAVDAAGNVYVADTFNQTLRKIAPDGAVTTLAGLAGSVGNSDGTGSAARFYFPRGMAVDASGNVYVADTSNQTIRKVSPAGMVTTLAPTFAQPFGVAVTASGILYVSDVGRNTILAVFPAAGAVSVAGLAGSSGSADGVGADARFSYPAHVALDASGNVYVADYFNHTIRRGVAPAVQIALFDGDGQTASTGAAVATPPAVILSDGQNNPVSDVSVTFAVASGGGSITGATQTTGTNGVAAVESWTLGAMPGSNTLTASASWVRGSPVTFSATGVTVSLIASFTATPVLVSAGGASTLAWTAASGSTLTLDESPVASPSGSQVVNPTRTTTYTLTATQGGASSSKSVTVTVSDGSAALAAPAVTSPATGQTVTVSAVSFTWTAVSGADGYEIRVVDDASGQAVFSGSLAGGTSTSSVLSLPNGRYQFAVRACTGGFGATTCGPYGSVGPFTVSLSTPTAAPTVTAPANGSNLTASTTTLSWTAVAGATSYEVVLKNRTNSTTALQITVFDPATSTIFSLASGSYELKVRACQAACGPASAPSNFTVTLPATPTPAPTITSATLSGTDLTVVWTAVANADLYQIQVVQPGAGPGGGALSVAARQVSETSVTLPVPQGQASIVVAACNGDGCGPFSAPSSISPAAGNPPLPNLGTPMKGTVVAGPVVNFSWNRVPGDDGGNTIYRLFVADLSRQTTALDVYTTQNFWAAYFKAEGARYDAQVIANPTCTGVSATCSAAESAGPAAGFNVAGTSAVSPTLNSPAHQSSVEQGNLMLGWTPVSGATLYQYYISGGGQNPAVTGVTTGLFAQVPLFAVDSLPTPYVGIVRACPAAATCAAGSDAGWGPWSDQGGPGVTSFTVTP